MEKLSPLLTPRTVSLAEDNLPSLDLWRLTYSPLTSSTIQGAPNSASDRSRSLAKWDFPVPFRTVMMLSPPSSPEASIWTCSPSACPTLNGLLPPFMTSRVIWYGLTFDEVLDGSHDVLAETVPSPLTVPRTLHTA